MKKESFDILANFFNVAHSVGEGAIPGKTVLDYLTRLTIIEMVNEKIGKLNVWDFVDTDKSRRMNILLHKGGFLYATNRRLLLKINRDYSSDLEGKSIRKDGSVERYPFNNFESTLSGCESIHSEKGKKIKIDFDKFLEVSKECKAIKKMSRGTIRPIVSLDEGSTHFYYDELINAIQFMNEIDVDEISIIPNSNVASMIVKDGNVCLLMPVMGDFRQMSNVFEM